MTPLQKKLVSLVCRELDVDEKLLFKKNRTKEVVLAKYLCVYLFKTRFGFSYNTIGKMFNGMHHTSMIYAKKSIQDGLDVGDDYVTIPYNKVTRMLSEESHERIPEANKLVITFKPDFAVDKMIEMLNRSYRNLQYELVYENSDIRYRDP